MSEAAKIVGLWRSAQARKEECILATVVRVEGSSYRKPGARMLLTRSGQRAGTISGGCLEAEVARKAWWLTEHASTVERYESSFDEDGHTPYGLGCGGTIELLLERGAAIASVMDALERSYTERAPTAIVTVVATHSPATIGKRLILNARGEFSGDLLDEDLKALARDSLTMETSRLATLNLDGERVEVFAEYLPPVVSLLVFGAGDDAQPLVESAALLGWQVTVVDGRSHLARTERFPSATSVVAVDVSSPLTGINAERADAVVLMTHSYEQDKAALAAVLAGKTRYIGVLGPRKRTARLVADVAEPGGLDPADCMGRLHSPAGLDVGADTPAAIALSIVAEIHASLRGRNGLPLRERMGSEFMTPVGTGRHG